MKRVHLTCGAVYLQGYENCDIVGTIVEPFHQSLLADGIVENPNATTLDKYYRYPLELDFNKRVHREFLVDRLMDIKKEWPWEDNSLDEIVEIASFEHFEHKTEIPHIIKEAHRCLKKGGIWKFDFPDIKGIINTYADKDDQFMMEQIYCNRKNEYSVHCWSYTENTIPLYLDEKKWNIKYGQIVHHDYPMIGVTATKR